MYKTVEPSGPAFLIALGRGSEPQLNNFMPATIRLINDVRRSYNMQNIIEIVKAILGVELTQEQEAELTKQTAANYKTVAEFDKKIKSLESDRDGFKERAETAEKTLQGFEGVDLETMKTQLAEYKARAEQAQTEFQRQIAQRDFDDALTKAMEDYKFSSTAARDAIMAEIRGKGLSLVDGKIVGLGDVMDIIKERDAAAFEPDEGDKPARFTGKLGGGANGKKYATKEEILKIEDPVERQQAIGNNLQLFQNTD